MKKSLPAGIFFFILIFHLPVFSQSFSLLKDINYGNPVLCQGNPRQPLNLTEFNGILYFTINADASSAGLWKTDGTEAGTIRIKEVVAIEKLIAVDGQLFFFRGTFGPSELWTSDGTEAGTQIIKTLNSIDNLTNVNGTLFFSADSDLWKSNGTDAGTLLVKSFTSISNLVNANGTLFFSAIIGPPFRSTLWKSDGTEAGTTLVKDNISMTNPLDVNGVLYFTGNDGTSGAELWKTDGTETGTILVKDMEPGLTEVISVI
jgi:ELWxxDGT repeat protein